MRTQGELALKREGNRLGYALLIYKGIMNVAVILVTMMAMIPLMIRLMGDTMAPGSSMPMDPDALSQRLTQLVQDLTMIVSGWGYLLAVAVGTVLLLVWKKPRYVGDILKRRGRAMGFGKFWAIMCLFLSAQLLYQMAAGLVERLLQPFGVSFFDFMEANAVSTETAGMFLYVCLAAPIFEELVFRGLMLHGLMPYGRRFAVVMSALFFGLYHGSPLQSMYAILVGLVLGYVAAEYHILWAMVLHMINNLLVADTLPRLLNLLPLDLGNVVQEAIFVLIFLIALVILLIKHESIVRLWKRERVHSWQLRGFFRSPGMILLSVACFAEIGLFIAMLFLA